uniref:Uncharacterized protein n=1 Tax=Fagus sylvatica TaxID=28930 RepID=A0A2N9FCK7_FAGSY
MKFLSNQKPPNLSNQKPPWRSEGSTTSRPLGSARQGGSCFAAWWWLASVVTDLRREPRRGSLLGGGWPRCGFARRGLGFARQSRPGCGGLRRSRRGGGAVGVVVGLPILRCLWRG